MRQTLIRRMSCPFWSLGLICLFCQGVQAHGEAARQRLRFAENCRVIDAVWAANHVCLLVGEAGGHATVAIVDEKSLFHYIDVIDLSDNVQAISATRHSELVVLAGRPPGPGRNGLNCRLISGFSPSKIANKGFCPTDAEGSPLFLPSEQETFVTAERITSVTDFSARHLNEKIRVDAADVSGKTVLVGISARRVYSTTLEDGGLFFVNRESGACARAVVSEKHFDPHRDKVIGIRADPLCNGYFFLAIMERRNGGGRLLYAGKDGDCKAVYSRSVERSFHLEGLPLPPVRRTSDECFEEPVLAIASHPLGGVYLLTQSGVYQVDAKGQSTLLGIPSFEEIGGFFIARNIPDLSIILSRHADGLRQSVDNAAAITAAFLVPHAR